MVPLRAFQTVAIVFLCVGAATMAERLSPQELVARHLDKGLGPVGLRTGHDAAVAGIVELSGRQVGTGVLTGAFTLDSNLLSSTLLVYFGTNRYEGETFAFDGQGTDVGFGDRRPGRRSALGEFIAANDTMLREGLLGGTLNARWPLVDLAGRQAKVRYDGVKKFDGRDLHRLWYRARKGQDQLEIQLYFEPETYRHVATVYSRSRAQDMGNTITQSSQESDVHFRLEERFSDFSDVDGLTLPTVWRLRYERSGNTTTEWKYDLKATSIRRKPRPAVSASLGRDWQHIPALGF